MIGRTGQARFQVDAVRGLVAVFAPAVAVVAVVADPGSVGEALLTAIPVAALILWTVRPDVPLALVSLAVVVPVVVAQRSGGLEPLMFEVSLLAFVVGRFARSAAGAAALGLVAVACPVAVSVVQDPGQISVGLWVLGVAFPWVLGRAVARQAQLAAQLEATQRALADQALLEERRRIARDVHDLVGHGLAAVMLQLTSARYVLRRDPAAAEEALRSAEQVGRRSMGELRRAVGLLRSADEEGAPPPVPSVGEIPALVDETRAGGLAVELRMRGDVAEVPADIGVALYRVTQEALANAVRHAPHARTVLELELADGRVELVADTTGSVETPSDAAQRPRYGLIGMRERATALGGEFSAGPTAEGWRVSCRVPVEVEAP